MEQIENQEEDFIASLFQRGYLHVLEKIILEFPEDTISQCRKVSQRWSTVVNYFEGSKIPRILKFRDVKLDQAWREKQFSIRSNEMRFVAMTAGDILCHDLIADEQHIIIQATRCKFHQHFTCCFFVLKSFVQLFSSYSLALNFFGKRILAQKLLIKF